ncbi:MAG TPA: deoxyguanosinetriphosphate triphosphohydrolase [Pseudoclavibacter sp.]|nr:deoxyguanosinetriphosphate triphosphohydrolase [Pseudoclavibacter sp.]
MTAGYTARDRERFFPEVHNVARTDFERDRGRLIHSSALRRLSSKTAVHSPLAGLDFARNRLTHTLEVAQVGRELGMRLGLDPDVVETACLAHDLGHPPFGHNGEVALNEWAQDIGGFEGNAQSLRLLARLEPKVLDDSGHSFGLNLTRASLDASVKYPWMRPVGIFRVKEGLASAVKWGVYADDLPVFEWMREGSPEGRPSVEAQTMDFADDVAYSVHDFEDAVVAGYLGVHLLSDPVSRDALIQGIRDWTKTRFSPAELDAAILRLTRMSSWVKNFDGSRRALAALKNLTSQLIGRFCVSVQEATREAFPTGHISRYQASVVVPKHTQAEIVVLKGTVGSLVMASDARRSYYARQREIMLELAEVLWINGPADLERPFADDWAAAEDDDARKRVVVDQVASLTDQSATAWHERLTRPILGGLDA